RANRTRALRRSRRAWCRPPAAARRPARAERDRRGASGAAAAASRWCRPLQLSAFSGHRAAIGYLLLTANPSTWTLRLWLMRSPAMPEVSTFAASAVLTSVPFTRKCTLSLPTSIERVLVIFPEPSAFLIAALSVQSAMVGVV